MWGGNPRCWYNEVASAQEIYNSIQIIEMEFTCEIDNRRVRLMLTGNKSTVSKLQSNSHTQQNNAHLDHLELYTLDQESTSLLKLRMFLVSAEIPIALSLRVSFVFVIGVLGTACGIDQWSIRRIWALDTSAYSFCIFFLGLSTFCCASRGIHGTLSY
jgi:hypothetical protein